MPRQPARVRSKPRNRSGFASPYWNIRYARMLALQVCAKVAVAGAPRLRPVSLAEAPYTFSRACIGTGEQQLLLRISYSHTSLRGNSSCLARGEAA
jgi:hypothetical protein